MDTNETTPRTGGLDENRFATLLIRHHGMRALRVAATRAMKLGVDGDREGALEWLAISLAVREMRGDGDETP